jgi:hypothetical protein
MGEGEETDYDSWEEEMIPIFEVSVAIGKNGGYSIVPVDSFCVRYSVCVSLVRC